MVAQPSAAALKKGRHRGLPLRAAVTWMNRDSHRAAVIWMDQNRHTRLPPTPPPMRAADFGTDFPSSASCKIRTICSSL